MLILSTTYFLITFNNGNTFNSTILIPELKPFTSVYDNAIEYSGANETPLLTGITYAMIVLISIITIAIQIYTASRLISRHPNYVMCATGLIVAIAALICPNYLIGRVFDTRIVGVFVVSALIFDIIALTWIYGAKNIYTDLEFSIGRPISKVWLYLWWISPLIFLTLLIWWSVDFPIDDIMIKYVPRWLPIAISLSIIAFIAFTEVYKQVDYNFYSMIREASVPSKDWGPSDPLARHSWKQWTSVCEDTGQKDFTLRRRGTRDYTHSIKRNQCSNKANSAYSVGNVGSVNNTNGSYVLKTSTLGRNSPNYAGSIFGDSAIEEDFSIANYPVQYNTSSQRMIIPNSDERTKSIRSANSDDPRKMIIRLQQNSVQEKQRIYIPAITSSSPHATSTIERDKNRLTDKVISTKPDYSSRILINSTPQRPSVRTSKSITSYDTENNNYGSLRRGENPSPFLNNSGSEHICWRKYANNTEEFSTEL